MKTTVNSSGLEKRTVLVILAVFLAASGIVFFLTWNFATVTGQNPRFAGIFAGVPESVVFFLTVISAFVLFSIFPLIAVICGWYTKNKIISVLLGAVPFPSFMLANIALGGPVTISGNWLLMTIMYYAILAGVGGLTGYYAAKGTMKYLAVSVALAAVWVIVLFSGIH